MKCLLISNGRIESKEEANSTADISINNYYIPCVEAALNFGYEVYIGTNKLKSSEIVCSNYPIRFHYLGIFRNVFDFKKNYIAYKNLREFLKSNKIELLHCNTPIGGVLGRICGKKFGINKVVYTVHGFHFYTGAPLLNRTLFYWVEKLLAKITDVVITINEEDYQAALKLNKNWIVKKVHGVGIDKIDVTKSGISRSEFGLTKNDIIIISAGDLNKNKNNEIILRAMACMKKKVHYFICGRGDEQKSLERLVREYDLESYVHFLGFRNDINELLSISDIFVMPSLREGLSRSLMEAMGLGLPCVVSKIRGNNDLIKEGVGGFLCGVKDYKGFASALDKLSSNVSLRKGMGEFNKEEIKPYYVENVKKEMLEIYDEIINK